MPPVYLEKIGNNRMKLMAFYSNILFSKCDFILTVNLNSTSVDRLINKVLELIGGSACISGEHV